MFRLAIRQALKIKMGRVITLGNAGIGAFLNTEKERQKDKNTFSNLIYTHLA